MWRRLILPLSCILTAAAALSAATVSGTVESSNGDPIAGARVFMMSMTGQFYTDSTDTNGEYGMTGVVAGDYVISASKTGYATLQGERITVGQTNLTHNFTLTPTGGTGGQGQGKIIGTVTNSATQANITGATVVLLRQGIPADTTTTSAAGAYSFDSLTRSNYRVVVSATGFAVGEGITGIAGTETDTVNIALRPIETGAITGKVTADSANGTAISGARVLVETRPIRLREWTPVDTVVTSATGVYSSTGLATGSEYRLTVTKEGYVTQVTRAVSLDGGTDTIHVVLAKVASGGMYIYVGKATDSSALSAAAIVATNGNELTATTGTTGWASFIDAPIGQYRITVSKAGFTPKTITNTVALNDKDTIRIYLVASTDPTKVFRGTVTDSATGSAVTNARIILTVATAGGQAIFFDSTDTQGKYFITGIPSTTFFGQIGATATGFISIDGRQVTIGQPGVADTATYNFKMVKQATGIAGGGVARTPSRTLSVTVVGTDLVVNGAAGSTVSLFAMDGKLVYRTTVPSRSSSMVLPGGFGKGKAYIVRVASATSTLTRKVIVP